MARFLWSKAKLCRALWINIFWLPKIDKIIQKRSSWKRGMVRKKSEYWTQLREKQIARFTFWLSEKQFKKYYQKAVSSKNVTWEELIRQMEMRIDNVVYRAWLAESRPQARQMVAHWHFELNWRRITIPSIQFKTWDKLILRKKLQNSSLYSESPAKCVVKWIKADVKKKEIEMVEVPAFDELEQSIKTSLIIEYYSR